MLAVCSADEIRDALVLVAPYAKWDSQCRTDTSDGFGASISVLMAGQAIVVALFGEIGARGKLSARRLEKRTGEVIAALASAIEAKKAKWAELRARPISDEEKIALAAGL